MPWSPSPFSGVRSSNPSCPAIRCGGCSTRGDRRHRAVRRCCWPDSPTNTAWASAAAPRLVYRLAGDFRQFQALAGIDDRVRPAGNVRLVVSGDGKELFGQTITGSDDPLAVAVDITGVKRLRILVDFGEQVDIADCLDLCDARITK